MRLEQPLSARARSTILDVTAPNPKSTRASRSRLAFLVDGSTNTSRSSVRRGSPCPATACPPMRTNRTRRAISNDKNSLQSRVSSIFTEKRPPKSFDARDAILERERRDVFAVGPRRLLDHSSQHRSEYDFGADQLPRGISPPLRAHRPGRALDWRTIGLRANPSRGAECGSLPCAVEQPSLFSRE